MCICSKISIAVELRLLFSATVLVFANFGYSVTDVCGQIPDQIATRGPQSQATPPVFSPLPRIESDFTAPQVLNSAKEERLGQTVAQTAVQIADVQTSNPVPHSVPNQTSLPNFFLPYKHGSTDPKPRVNQVVPAKTAAASPASWISPINPALGRSRGQNNSPSTSKDVNQVTLGVANQNIVPRIEPITNQNLVTNSVAPLGQSYFESTAANQQTVDGQTTLVLPPVAPIYTPPVNRTHNQSGLLAAYQSRAILQSHEDFQATQTSKLPKGFQPWWVLENKGPIGLKASPLQVSLDGLIQRALTNSPHIQVAATEPHIRNAVLLEESSRFDWRSFLESTYDDQNEPVGNTLTLGNDATRLSQQQWSAEGGIRRQTRTGGEFELSQSFSTLQNNSIFLVPEDQGNSRIVLNYRQPLLKGRGRAVNESLIVLANIGLKAASDEFLTEIQQHLTDLTETYWELVRARSELLQRSRLLTEAQKILIQLEGRVGVDALDRQVFRARSAVAKRRAEIARSVTSVKNAESRIRLLVNDQEIINAARMELVPVDMPNIEHLGINLGDAISTALSNRPDISRSIREVKATSVQLGISRNDLLPKLDFLVGSYVAGLEDQFDIAGAWRNQFSNGRPGFNVGFEFETAIGNRAAQARQSRRAWEANRAVHQFRAIVESGLTEVELAVREVHTSHQEMIGRYHAMVAAQKESSFLADRWKTLPDESDSVVLLLENLLDSQERLVNEEAAFAKAQFDYSVAVVKLKQATGTLFQVN